MKHVALIVAAIVVGVVGYSAAAWSAAPPTPTEKLLLKDVKALQAKVTKLQTDVKKATATANGAGQAAGAAIIVSGCGLAITADSLQGTWQVIDQISAATQAGKTYFGAQTPVVDTLAGQPICQTIGVSRSQAVPPTVAQHAALLALLR